MSRETDAAVATEVMGWPTIGGADMHGLNGYVYEGTAYKIWPTELFCPSTSIADAWMVVEQLTESSGRDMMVRVDVQTGCACNVRVLFDGKHGFEVERTAHADTAPEAICLAALEAVRSEP